MKPLERALQTEDLVPSVKFPKHEKVLLRERKRHTARRVAIAISCYSGGGGSLDKTFFSSLNMYQAKSGVKNFSLYWGGGGWGGPWPKFFFRSEHVSSQIWCQKFFPLLGGGGGQASPWQQFFFRSEHVSSQIWCQKFFPLLRGGPLTKIFFPSLNMYQAKSGVKKFSLYWDRVPPPWTDTHLWKHNLPSYVRTRAVKTKKTGPSHVLGKDMQKRRLSYC